jgi:hypothetical protein
MKAPRATSSEITLVDFAGLMKDLMDKLLGKKAVFWLKSLKKFLRKENPWPPIRKLFTFTVGNTPAPIEIISKIFEETGFSTPCLENFSYHPNFNPKPWDFKDTKSFRPQFSLVGVLVSDLLSAEERVAFTYPQILERAEEFGLTPCDILNGFNGVAPLIRDQTLSHVNKPLSFVICSTPFEEQGGLIKRLLTGIIWPGEVSKRGSMNLQTIDHEEYSLRFQSNPDCLMIFMSVIE